MRVALDFHPSQNSLFFEIRCKESQIYISSLDSAGEISVFLINFKFII